MARGGAAKGQAARKHSIRGQSTGDAQHQTSATRKPDREDEEAEFNLASWGRGNAYQLGNGEPRDRVSPMTMLFTKCPILKLACGAQHTLMLLGPSFAPRLFAWGEGQHGQLGVGKSSSMQAMHPILVPALATTSNFVVKDIGAGGNSSFALTSQLNQGRDSRLELLLWGDNAMEQLGLGKEFKGVEKIFSPTPLSMNWDTTEMQWRKLYIQKAVMGRKFGLAIDTYGRLYAWGDNSHGQLGLGDKASRNTPVCVETLPNVRHVAVGLQHSAAIDSRRQLWTWGDCDDGRLGHGTLYTEERLVQGDLITRIRKRVDQLLEPKCVEFFRHKQVSLVACGDRFTAALDARGMPWTWGSGIYGQLGAGSLMSTELPVRISSTSFVRGSFPQEQLKDAPVVLVNEDERGQKDADGHDRTPRSMLMSEESRDSGSIPGLSRGGSPGGLPNRQSSDFSKPIIQEDVSPVWENSSHTMPSFRTIQAGPYHCAALTEDSRLFFWGKGNHGVLGQGDEHNQYEPVQIKTDTNKPVQSFATGEFHSVLLQPCVRQDLWDYTLRYVPNTDLFVFIPERKKLNEEDLASRFNADEGAPVERYNPEGRTSKGLFSNVIDVTQNGKIVLDNGLEVVEVDPDQIEPSRALSVRAITRDVTLDRKGIIPDADKFLGCEGWDLLDEHIPEWPVEMTANLDPLLVQATPSDTKSKWIQYTTSMETPKARVSSPTEDKKVRGASYGKGAGFTGIKTAMAVEDQRMFDQYHDRFVAEEKNRILSGHNRKPCGSVNTGNTCSILRMPLSGGKSVEPCSAIFGKGLEFTGKAERFTSGVGMVKSGTRENPKHFADESHPSSHPQVNLALGPGEYGVKDSHPEWCSLESVEVIKPAGVGITLTLREMFGSFSNRIEDRKKLFAGSEKPLQFEIVVKEILKGGSVESSTKNGYGRLAVNDVILKIDGGLGFEDVTQLYQARRLMMGEPGTKVSILYKHKDKSGEFIKFTHSFKRRYIGKHEDCIGADAKKEIYPAPGKYVGLGLTAERFNDQDLDILTEEQEQEVLNVIYRLQAEMIPDNDNLLKNRLCAIPTIRPGVKRVTEEILTSKYRDESDTAACSRGKCNVCGKAKESHFAANLLCFDPEWAQKVSRPNVIMRVFKKYKLIEPVHTHACENPHLGPCAYSPKRTAAHNWTEDGKIAQSFATIANATGPKWVTPEEKIRLVPTREELRREAELIAIGRELEPGEFERLPINKQRSLQAMMAFMDKREDTGPGPLQYSPVDCDAIGQPKAYKANETGHHLKGVTIAPKGLPEHSKGAAIQDTPGPAHYDIRREGLGASGDFYDRKGCTVVYRDSVGPDGANKEVPGILYTKPGGIGCEGHPTYANAPRPVISSREQWEKLGNRETGQVYDQGTKTWIEGRPGPGAYTPRPPSAARSLRLHGREALTKEQARRVWNGVPGPEYTPLVSKDGRSMDIGKSPRGNTLGIRLARRMTTHADMTHHSFDGLVTPGPGYYSPSFTVDIGNTNSGYIGEKAPHVKNSMANVPGPGAYETAPYDAIGTDLVSIGAAARAAFGSSATGKPEPVLNYSAMNGAAEELKKVLKGLFDNIYEAFTFFDIDGSLSITKSELKKMLGVLEISIDDTQLGLVVRRMDTSNDGSIDPKEFIQALRWHSGICKKGSDEEAAMFQTCKQKRPAILKSVMFKVAENRVHRLKIEKRREQEARTDTIHERPKTARENVSHITSLFDTKPSRPLTARTDMRRGFTMSPRRLNGPGAPPPPTDTPGPEIFARAGDIGVKVGSGKNSGIGVEVHDAQCWAGSALTRAAAPISGKCTQSILNSVKSQYYSVPRFPEHKLKAGHKRCKPLGLVFVP